MKVPQPSLPMSWCFGTKLAPSRQDTDTELTWPAQAVALPQPAQTKHERHARWTAMLPLLMPYAHKIPHTFDTSQCTALPSDRLLPAVHNPFRTAYTGRHRGGIFGHETRTPEACNRPWSCTSVRSPEISECVRVPHGGPPASNNVRLFECTSHGSLGRAEYIFASPRRCDALLGPTSAGRLTHRRTMHNPWARS
jgi:hypothetical protein